jgi:hypothetical protein
MAKVINSDASKSLEFYYDEEIFDKVYTTEPDPTTMVLLESGAVVEDGEIARLIADGGNFFTRPFYKTLEGDEVNYDGVTNITTDANDSGVYSGVVYGRAKGWKAIDFVADFSTADPMRAILNQIQKWKSKKMQTRLIGILNAVLGITGSGATASWENHKKDICSETTTITDDNKISLTTLRKLTREANGDQANNYALAIMHSEVASRLEELQIMNFYRYNKDGIEYDVNVGRSGNLMVLVTDEVPAVVNADTNATEYTTYILGRGAIGSANAPVARPTEISRDPATQGGMTMLYTRYRHCFHPYGFTFGMENLPTSPTDVQLSTSANWSIVFDPKTIYIASLKSNG